VEVISLEQQDTQQQTTSDRGKENTNEEELEQECENMEDNIRDFFSSHNQFSVENNLNVNIFRQK
jgi:hypothetical protein